MYIKILPLILIIFYSITLNAENKNDSLTILEKTKTFGAIYTDFYYGLNNNSTPKSAFGLSTALVGFKTDFSKKVSTILIYDVTRTTNAFEVTDTSGNILNVSYFEGSKYTAFLKMAEIKWNINNNMDFSVGQLLNSQYLTLQDKFWKHRYVMVTFQEAYRFGMPADFGARFHFSFFNKKLNYYIAAFNGEGPFRYQDNNGKFLFANNIEYYPTNNIILKFYMGTEQPQTKNDKLKNIYSGFIAYKTKKFRAGIEYNYVSNYNFSGIDYSGYSIYGMYDILTNIEIFGRYDYIKQATNIQNSSLYIAGLQYKPVKNLSIGLNFRQTIPNNEPRIYASFGVKF